MEIAINPDLLTVMLLYSLPGSFENFRCAIESRDNLPTPESLRTKIIEEYDARKNVLRGGSSDTMFVKKHSRRDNRNHATEVKDNAAKRSLDQSRCFYESAG